MSLSATLVLKNRLDADVTYTRLNDDDASSTYADNASTLGLPRTLKFAVTQAPLGQTGNDKVLVKFSFPEINATTGKVEMSTWNVTGSIPRTFSSEKNEDAIALIKSALTAALITSLRRGEV